MTAEASSAVPGPLSRLGDPAARTACLDAIVAAYGGRVVVADFGRFQGQPALIVLLDGASFAGGGRGAVVVGSQCGIGNTADVRYKQAL